MSFDRLSSFYPWLEDFCAGGCLQQCRVACFNAVPTPERILILGEGHGRTLAACLRHFPSSHITCVEASKGMIAQARRHLEKCELKADNVEFVHADVLEWDPPQGAFDLLATHFFLDCFREDQLQVLIPKIAAAGTARAHWLVSDFQVARAGWRRWRSQVILWLLYRFFRRTTHLSAQRLIPPADLLTAAGFTCRQSVEIDWGLLRSECWQNQSAGRTPDGSTL